MRARPGALRRTRRLIPPGFGRVAFGRMEDEGARGRGEERPR
ncbi:hypothetical protein SGL43_07239 [Streptomyces globisporus]|uniref:Uncharacterized protein n=1 Tax=Streptomyces globisporus TaxID=1908 RepID=A0ABM9H922_STRGL|nr:hypothetical protein SGL43_07239 [Streptomyces globisporus]